MPDLADRHPGPASTVHRAWGFWKDWITPVIAAVASILATLVGIYASTQETRLARLDAELRAITVTQEAQRHERTDREALNFKLFEAVRAALTSKNENEQRAVTVLVTTMADSAFASDLLEALRQQGVVAVQHEITTRREEAQQFDQEGAPPARAAPLTADAWRCDVFWATRSGADARGIATGIEASLRGRWRKAAVRVRELPDLVNAREGYRASGFEIRYDPAELDLALEMKALLDPLVGPLGRKFGLRQVGTPTPGYLSIFACP